jgi:hypothetical protein
MPSEREVNISDWHQCTAYDGIPIVRLGSSLFLNCRFPEGRVMGFFTAFFDASGNSIDQPYVVVAGYIGNWCQWQLLENQWRAIHKEHGVEIPFHASDFIVSQSYPERYAKQKNARPDYVALARTPDAGTLFLRRLCVAQLSFTACGISSIIPLRIYDELDAVDLQKRIPPFALGARMCLARIHEWERLFQIRQPVECIFEEGDFGQGQFSKLMVDEGADIPIYKKKQDYAGLQAADHYAWEQAFFLKKELEGRQSPERTDFIAQLHMIPHMHGTHNAESLLRVCQLFGIEAKLRSKHETKQ